VNVESTYNVAVTGIKMIKCTLVACLPIFYLIFTEKLIYQDLIAQNYAK